MKFCGQCGARLGVACAGCGFVNPAPYRFCGMCGRRLADGEIASPTPLAMTAKEEIASQKPLAMTTGNGAITPLAGERRIATSLLADVRSSTDLMELLGTEAWVQLMNRVLQLLAAEVSRFGGRVDQFRGDGLVAFFGATDAHEDDPERAVLAGLAMHEAIQACAAELKAQVQAELKVRVGINTGEVIVASVGEAAVHREETAMGGGVALAARMETAAEPGTVLVSEHTYRLIEGRFEWQPLGEITVKGIVRPVAVYRPLRSRTTTDALAAYDLTLPFTGRETAFAALTGCVAALCSGRGGIALVTGEKGMGKSLLTNRARQHFAQRTAICPADAPQSPAPTAAPAVTWLSCTCRSYDQAIPYAMWVGLLRFWLEAAAGGGESDPAALLRQQAAALWGVESAPAAEHYAPYLATLLSLPIEDAHAERIAHLKAEELQKQLAQALYGWVEALARQGPLVLAFSDLQWADASSLEALKRCLPICDTAPILWLASFRPDRAAPVWAFSHHVETEYPHRLTSIDLPPLTADESRALVEALLGRRSKPDALADRALELVIEKGEGNPYYLREIIYALIGQGLLRQDAAGAWRPTQPIASFDLPGSLRSLLLARVDRLAADEHRVLQIAAVIGPLFWRKVLAGCLEDDDLLQRCLANLQRGQLIHEQSLTPDLGMEYTFTPSLVRDIIYESLLSSQRATYHRLVAEQIEASIPAESQKPYHGLLAYHYRQAGDPNQELFHALGAAEEAQRLYANADALAHYDRALTLLDQIERAAAGADQLRSIHELRFETLEGRRRALIPMGHVEAARADARALLPLAERLADDPIFTADALLVQPEVETPGTREELAAGLRMAQEALALVQQAGDKRREMHALVAVAGLRLLLKDPGWQELGQQAFALSRQLGDQRMQIGLLLGISDAFGMDDLQRSAEYLQEALAISQRLADKETEARLLAALSPRCERAGDYYRQLTEYEQKRIERYRAVGNRLGEGHALMFCGQILAIYLGDTAAGLALMHDACTLWSETPDKLFPLLRIAQIQALAGQLDAAWATLEQARAASERVILDIGHAGLHLVEAILHNAAGGEAHWRAALALQGQVKQMVTADQLSRQYQMAAACEAAAAHLGLAGCLADAAERAEHRRQALIASQAALDTYQQFGFTQVVECLSEAILFRHSLALAANDRAVEAGDFLARAHAEMMRKHDLIPAENVYRRTFLEGLGLHREIRAAYARR
jgi:class 3 adenylate cyclase/type II secretory pathway predicted ATPase ExeA